MNFFDHMDISERVTKGQATQEDAKKLLDEVNTLRKQRNELSSKLVKAYGLAHTAYLSSQENALLLDKELEQISLRQRVETSTDYTSDKQSYQQYERRLS